MARRDWKGNARLKISEDKVFSDICALGLFGCSADRIIDKVAKFNAYTYATIKPLFNKLVESQQVVINSEGVVENNMKIVSGKLITKPGERFGHVKVKDKEIYVYDRGLAVDGDIVEITLRQAFGKQEGVVTRILERGHKTLSGIIEKKKDNISGKYDYVFYPSNRKFDLPVLLFGQCLEESVGMKVKVSLIYADLSNTSKKINPVLASVEKIYGRAGDPIVENVAIAEEHGFYKDFPDEVTEEADKIPSELTEEDRAGTIDLTHIPFYTIDPKTCKDIDDAIYVEKTENGYCAYVALADVEYYVMQNSELDKEAYERGTSCYLGDGVYPMLPENLSNGICSLNPNEDRRALVGRIFVDKTGEIEDYEFCQAVIRSRAKLSYETAEEIHNGKIQSEIYTSLQNAYELSDILVQMRKNRGAITINSSEPTFLLDETGLAVNDIVDKSNIPSTKIIESLMILYNEAIGDLVAKNKLEALFRVHFQPDKDRIAQINAICSDLGVDFVTDTSSKGINTLLEKVRGKTYEEFVNTMVLLNLKKAFYSAENYHHFALASENYIHSTAAIRRYPDIIIQRVLANFLKGKIYSSKGDLPEIANNLSQREIDADEAERESDRYMGSCWADENKYKPFSARIKAVTKDGVYVTLSGKMVSVFIPLKDLATTGAKNFKLNKTKTRLENKAGDRRISVGDKMLVIITSVDKNRREVFGEQVRSACLIESQVNKSEEVRKVALLPTAGKSK